MVISRTSWHYRLIDRYAFPLSFSIPNSLCSYFWCLMFWLAFEVACALAIIATVCFVVWCLLWYIYFWIYDTRVALELHLLIIGGATFLTAYFWTWNWARERDRRRGRRPFKPREPNIAWEYIKAKKRKVCPIITFE